MTDTGSESSVPARGQRLYLHEPGWQIAQKHGSVREFCYMMAPGQDYYHRLLDGEIYLFSNEERLCVACAERRGLISYEPKGLQEGLRTVDRAAPEGASEFEVRSNSPEF